VTKQLMPAAVSSGVDDPLHLNRYYDQLHGSQTDANDLYDFSFSKFRSIVFSQIPAEFKRLRELILTFCQKDGDQETADIRKITLMAEAVTYMPLIISKDKNDSHFMADVMKDTQPFSQSFYDKFWTVGKSKLKKKLPAPSPVGEQNSNQQLAV
jgi:hypothetical protein